MRELTPREIVAELDKYIIGQHQAKKSVAVALRNRFRRKQLPEDIQDEVLPKNIIMIGPTGVGKTEIAPGWRSLSMRLSLKLKQPSLPKLGMLAEMWIP